MTVSPRPLTGHEGNPGMVLVADKGLSGTPLERFAADQIGVLLVHPDRKDAQKRRYGNLAATVNPCPFLDRSLRRRNSRRRAQCYGSSSGWPSRCPGSPRT
jgi:hypothetical protein